MIPAGFSQHNRVVELDELIRKGVGKVAGIQFHTKYSGGFSNSKGGGVELLTKGTPLFDILEESSDLPIKIKASPSSS